MPSSAPFDHLGGRHPAPVVPGGTVAVRPEQGGTYEADLWPGFVLPNGGDTVACFTDGRTTGHPPSPGMCSATAPPVTWPPA